MGVPPPDGSAQRPVPKHKSPAAAADRADAATRPDRSPGRVVGIGASAGGLEALREFFGAMPAQTGLVNCILAVDRGLVRVQEVADRHGLRGSIDCFVTSLAEAEGERAVAIVLSGRS